MSKDVYTKSLEVFMQKVAEKVKCLPDYTDPANENNHILRAIEQLLASAHNSDYAKSCDFCADKAEAEFNICQPCLDRLISEGN